MDSYNHIELSEEEIIDGMIWAKRKKAEEIRLAELRKFELENQRLRQMKWDFSMIKTFMFNRAVKIFGVDKETGKTIFELDENNERIFDIMCYYFMGDEENFILKCNLIGVKNPSLKKGLLIPGKFGVGKTWLMKLFSRNARQSFDLVRAKSISEDFLTSKEKTIPQKYLRLLRNNWDEQHDPSDTNYPNDEVFNQKVLGLCIDDLGSEDVKNNFGNKVNVIGDIIEVRYAAGFTGLYLHGTTNMTADQLKEFYGGRVTSRMREIFNFIELPGEDRRK